MDTIAYRLFSSLLSCVIVRTWSPDGRDTVTTICFVTVSTAMRNRPFVSDAASTTRALACEPAEVDTVQTSWLESRVASVATLASSALSTATPRPASSQRWNNEALAAK